MADGGTVAILGTSMDPNPQVKLPDSGHDSVRSTKSLSIFVNPDTPKEMARSEEVTMNMYADSPDDVSPNANSGRSKRRQRKSGDDAAAKENRKSDASKPGFFKFLKKKKTQETKVSESAVTTVEITSSSMHIGKKEGVAIDLENSQNHRAELESSRTSGDVGVAGPSVESSQIVGDKTGASGVIVELKPTTSATASPSRIGVATRKDEAGQPSPCNALLF